MPSAYVRYRWLKTLYFKLDGDQDSPNRNLRVFDLFRNKLIRRRPKYYTDIRIDNTSCTITLRTFYGA